MKLRVPSRFFCIRIKDVHCGAEFQTTEKYQFLKVKKTSRCKQIKNRCEFFLSIQKNLLTYVLLCLAYEFYMRTLYRVLILYE